MDIERLKTDPAYWDEVAPEGATHCCTTYSPFAWYRRTPNGWQFWTCFAEAWEHTGTLVHLLRDVISRPSQPQWRGPEDGLPPAGTVCEFALVEPEGLYDFMQEWRDGDILDVLALKDGEVCPVAVVWNRRTHQATALVFWHFRPLKSDKERAVEAALAQDCGPRDWMLSRLEFCARLYDAGLLRLPEEQ